MDKQIEQFIKKRTKAAAVLRMLLRSPYITCSDIINYNCEDTPLVFTTNPQKLIEMIRKRFGYDFVLSEELPFTRTMYTDEGKQYKVSDKYTRYFLNKMEGGINA